MSAECRGQLVYLRGKMTAEFERRVYDINCKRCLQHQEQNGEGVGSGTDSRGDDACTQRAHRGGSRLRGYCENGGDCSCVDEVAADGGVVVAAAAHG